MKTYFNKQQGFTLIELMIVVAIIGVLASIAIPSYREYMTSAKWGKTITSVRALKLAVENCLSDNSGEFKQCDALDSSKKVSSYGISQYAAETEEFSSIKILQNTAAIQIIGKQPLADCILTIKPSFTAQVGMITWDYTMASGSSLADVNRCRSFVRGANPA